MATSSADNRQLLRSLGLIAASSVILANIIGTGVFVKARVMTCNVGDPQTVLLVWLIAGLLTLAGALVYAELTAMMPRTGGEFHFLRSAFGERWAFLYGWTRSISVGASAAALAILCVVFMNDLSGGAMPDWALLLLPVLLIVLATGVNLATVAFNGSAVILLTTMKVALVLLLGLGAFLFADGDWGQFAANGASGTCEGVPASAMGGIGGFGAAMLGALWGYNGWAIIATVGGEIRDPESNMPRALIGATLCVVVLYLLINASFYYVLSPIEVASVGESSSVAYEAAIRFMGPAAAALISMGLVISAYGTLHATLLTTPRLPYELARMGLLPKALAVLSRRNVPAVAIIAVGAWSIVLAVTGTFDILTDMYIFILWIFFGMNGAAVIVLRRRLPELHRPHRVWGYPVVPGLFLCVTVYLLINTLVVTPGRALAGVGLIVTGLPVYAWFNRNREVVAGGDSAEASGEQATSYRS